MSLRQYLKKPGMAAVGGGLVVLPWHSGRRRYVWGRITSAWILLWIAAWVFGPIVPAQAQGNARAPANVEEFRALYIYNFAKYTVWPETMPDASDEFRIGVVGEGPLLRAMDILEGRKIHDREIVTLAVDVSASEEELSQYKVLFINQETAWQQQQLIRILDCLKDQPVLTVMEIDERGFMETGGIVNFVQRGNQLNFDINQAAAIDRGLQMDPRLLKLARKVRKARQSGSNASFDAVLNSGHRAAVN